MKTDRNQKKIIMIKPYERLAEFYDKEEWGKFSTKYVEIINDLKKRFNFVPNSILDISCGTGDLIYELSKEYKVVGSDLSEEMIAIARKKYPNLTFYVSDMADLGLEIKFDLILSPFDSINYIIEQNHLERVFRNIHNLLNENGCFLFDFNTDKLFEDKHRGIMTRTAAGTSFNQICEYHKDHRIARTIFDFGTGIKEVHIQKAYHYREIEDSLKRNDFEIEYALDIFKNEIVGDSSYKILIFAKKNIPNSAERRSDVGCLAPRPNRPSDSRS